MHTSTHLLTFRLGEERVLFRELLLAPLTNPRAEHLGASAGSQSTRSVQCAVRRDSSPIQT
jgi:hypothetical protein